MFAALSPPWQAAAGEAWAAFRSGSLPIGAAITNATGEVIAVGRNAVQSATSGQPVGCHRLAHAELNALLAADFRAHDPKTSALYATTEPCPLCLGACVMANLKRIHFASRDPWAGATNLLQASDYMRRQNVRAVGPHNEALENLLVALQAAAHLRQDDARAQPLLAAWQAIAPRGVSLGKDLHAAKLLDTLAAQSAPAAQVIDRLAEML